LLRSNCKLFNPPIPRFLFGSCCPDLAHGSNIRMVRKCWGNTVASGTT
jgi:hypothetical protein